MTCCKKILFLLLIFVFLFSSFCFATEIPAPVEVTDDNVFLQLYFESKLDASFLTFFNSAVSAYINNNATVIDVFNKLKVGYYFYCSDFLRSSDGSRDYMTARLYLYTDGDVGPNMRTINLNGKLYSYTYRYMNTSTSYSYNIRIYLDNSQFSIGQAAPVDSYVVPSNIYKLQPKSFSIFQQFIQNYNEHLENVDLLNDIYSQVEQAKQSLSRSEIQLQEITDILNNMKIDITREYAEQSEQIRNQLQQSTTDINNNINNNDVSDVDTSGITNADTTVDITQDGFNSIFNTLQSYFTSNNGGSLTITLPFVNKTITISKATVFGNFKQLSTIENFASLAWYFVISLYIVKSIQRMINKIKGGNLEDVVDNNVKADIL
jgi:hypothetical protein